MLKDSVDTTLATVGKIADLMRSAKSDSLIEYTKDTRVEPLVILDQSLRNQPYITDALHTANSIFAGYYLQAVAITTNVGNIDVVRLLGKLGTDRSLTSSAASGLSRIASLESYKDAVPTVSVEGRRDGIIPGSRRRDRDQRGSKVSSDEHVKLQDAANLAVGKLLSVSIKENGQEANVDVAIRLKVKTTGTDAIVNIMLGKAIDTSARTRKLQYDVGELQFWKDIIFCSDVIAAERKGMLADHDGTIEKLANRRSKNRLSGFLSGEMSVNNASAMMVVSTTTARRMEQAMNGELKKFKDRERMFENTLSMILMVVDTEWEQITIYHRSIEEPTKLSVKELKSLNKGTGPDVAEILKAYQMGNSPQF